VWFKRAEGPSDSPNSPDSFAWGQSFNVTKVLNFTQILEPPVVISKVK